MLDRAMEKQCSEGEAKRAEVEYQDRFSFLYSLFDKKPFHIEVSGKPKLSAALYDASMVVRRI